MGKGLLDLIGVGGKREGRGDGRGEADREKEASVRKIRGVFDVEDAREATESRLARNEESLFGVQIRKGDGWKYMKRWEPTREQWEFGEVGPDVGRELS